VKATTRVQIRLGCYSVAVGLLLALAAGCGGDNDMAGQPSRVTGVPEVDRVIAAVLAEDVEALMSMTDFTLIECIGSPQGGGSPPLCSDFGVPEGTKVEALPIAVSSTEFQSRAGAHAAYETWIGGGDFGLEYYGTLALSRHPFDFGRGTWPVPNYGVVFKPTRHPPARGAPDPTEYFAFYLRNGAIIAIQGFGVGAAQLMAPGDPSWLHRADR
jgi:hypothetical protein